MEVELGAQAAGELVEHVSGADALTEGRAFLGDLGDERESSDVSLHHLGDVGTLDLHDDGLARAQSRRIRLTDGCRGERLPLEALEHLARLAVELTVEHRLHPIDRLGCGAVLQQRELVAHFGREQIDPGGRDLSELHVHPAGGFEHSPQPHAFGHRRAFLAGGRAEEWTEPLSSSDADELLVAADDADTTLHGPQRARRRDEPRPLAGRQRARAREQVDRDRDGHREWYPDRDDVQHESVGSPIPVGQAQGEQRRGAPSEEPREERCRPPSPHAEQT